MTSLRSTAVDLASRAPRTAARSAMLWPFVALLVLGIACTTRKGAGKGGAPDGPRETTDASGGQAGAPMGGMAGAPMGTGGAGGSVAGPPIGGERSRARVFFSGHSLLDSPMPEYVGQIAASLGTDLKFNYQIVIGSPIRIRTKGENFDAAGWPGYSQGKNREGQGLNVVSELKTGGTLGGDKYDTLLLTERHDILDSISWEDTVGFARHFHDRLIDGNPQGGTLLYQTWLDLDKNAPANWIDHEKKSLIAWECVASKVNLTLAAANRADRMVTVPGGAALVDLVERVIANQVRGISGATPAKLNLIFRDDVHLTELGSYFLAAVHYSAIFRRSPVGARVPPEVPAETGADFQRIAWDYVRAYYAGPKRWERSMEECRSMIAQTVCVSYRTLLKEPQKIPECTQTFSNASNPGNPFRWPDPQLKVWPAP
jgi:hypothetical protein